MRNEDTRPAIIETDWDKWTSTDWDIQPGEAEFSHFQEVEEFFEPDQIDLETIKSFHLYTMKTNDTRNITLNEFISRLQSNPDDFPIL